jgi:hypothetical protein
MSKPVINTHAGDDSDGKLWGIEGINILFYSGRAALERRRFLDAFSATGALAGVQLRRRLAASRAGFRLRFFALRQGRPRSYGTDLLETLLSGRAWLPPRRQPCHPIHHHESA